MCVAALHRASSKKAGDSVRLCDVWWFSEGEVYQRIYRILSLNGLVPDVCSVAVLPPETPPPDADSGADGIFCRESNSLWFSTWPPEKEAFAHELIHYALAKMLRRRGAAGRKLVFQEEMFAWILEKIVVKLAENGITPPVNPVLLFNEVDEDMLNEAIQRASRGEFSDVKKFRKAMNVKPAVVNFVLDNGAYETYLVSELFQGKRRALAHVIEIVEALGVNELVLRMLVELLNLVKKRSARTTRAHGIALSTVSR